VTSGFPCGDLTLDIVIIEHDLNIVHLNAETESSINQILSKVLMKKSSLN